MAGQAEGSDPIGREPAATVARRSRCDERVLFVPNRPQDGGVTASSSCDTRRLNSTMRCVTTLIAFGSTLAALALADAWLVHAAVSAFVGPAVPIPTPNASVLLLGGAALAYARGMRRPSR
jgi:hypothetical protein